MSKINKKIINAIFVILLFGFILLITYMYFIINYPLSYQNIIKKYSEIYDIDPYLVAAIINVESKYDKNAVSKKEARGLMQISPITGKWAAKEQNIENFDLNMLFDPEVNIMIGTWYLNVLWKEFNGDLQLVLSAYNAGCGNVYKRLNDKQYSRDGKSLVKIPFDETKNYVDKVNQNIKIYKILYKDEFEKQPVKGENYLVLFVNNLRRVIRNFAIYK